MFSTHGNVISSDEGFSVKPLGRAGLLYREGGRCMEIDSEMLVGPSGLCLYADSIKRWLPPHENEAVEIEDRRRIVENICAAFRFQGIEILVRSADAALDSQAKAFATIVAKGLD